MMWEVRMRDSRRKIYDERRKMWAAIKINNSLADSAKTLSGLSLILSLLNICALIAWTVYHM